MNKFIITRWNDQLLTAQFSEKEVLEVSIEDENSILGNIYIGRVEKVIKNLNAAFITFADKRTGYYSLTDNPSALYADGSSSRPLKGGDSIIVQISKDAIKTKDPVLTSNLTFVGKYVVLTAKKNVIGFSGKIHDREWKDTLKSELEALMSGDAGLIVRTNAYGMEDEIKKEAVLLLSKYRQILEKAPFRTVGSLLYEAEPEYLKSLRGCSTKNLSKIITDEPAVYDTIKEYLMLCQPESLEHLELYKDPLINLANLYSLPSIMDQACQKRVWLKSGGYLIIEPTEAMVVIDVNSGKYSGKKNLADTIRMINLEAADEICHQLRLRNLSGIIIVDFIDMESEEDKTALLDYLRMRVLTDPVKVNIVDITPLGLVEITRKKEKKPLHEQLSRKQEIKRMRT